MNIEGMILRDTLDYLKYNRSDLFAFTLDGLTEKQQRDQKVGKRGNTKAIENCINVLLVDRSWALKNFDVFITLFVWHEGQTKVTRERISKVIPRISGKNNLDNFEGVSLLTFPNITYMEIEKGNNGTKSDALEQLICARLGYEWIGNDKKSAFFYHDTGKRIDHNRFRNIVPDGVKTLENGEKTFLEIKCKVGRFTAHSKR